MKEEISAGGIVFRTHSTSLGREGMDSGVAHTPQNDMLVLVSKHSGHHGWVFPKGHIGDKIKDETKEAAALREVAEETGINGTILKPLSPIDYWFQMDGEKRHKTVWYFLMAYASGDIKDHDWEMEEVEWLPIEQVEERLTYPGDKKVWQEAKEMIEKILN